jgi:SAM-dependent methyltransferase
MRVVDLDRDMSDVIPTGMTLDSDYLFARMTESTIASARPAAGKRVLDVASGVGQDSLELARRGATVIGAEPSGRMTGMAQMFAADKPGPMPSWVRGWSDCLPFATGTFDGAICKGALDHFDRPELAIAEMARVTSSEGRVVLAIANFESLACRVGRAVDGVRQNLFGWPPLRERRGYDAPSDHFTRYEVDLMREQAERYLHLESVEGISIGWGMPGWSRLVDSLPRSVGTLALQGLDWLARRFPELADVVVLVGRPRRSASTSA